MKPNSFAIKFIVILLVKLTIILIKLTMNAKPSNLVISVSEENFKTNNFFKPLNQKQMIEKKVLRAPKCDHSHKLLNNKSRNYKTLLRKILNISYKQ